MSNKHAKYTPVLCGVDMFGNKVYEGDWYVHKNESKPLIYKAHLTNTVCVIDHNTASDWHRSEAGYRYGVATNQQELTWCAKYPKNLGKSEKAIKGFRKLCGWEI